jgi:single-strand DNA-binding protein
LPLVEHRNEVTLVGRLSHLPTTKTLPSGDEIVTFRLVMARPRPLQGRQSTDWVDCVAFGARVRRAAGKWEEDDIIEVHGALRRRFWRGANGIGTSRCEIDVVRAVKAGPPAPAN